MLTIDLWGIICGMVFSIGGSERERLEIDVAGYERAVAGEYYDDNWLTIEVRVMVGGFKGKAKCSILTAELVQFTDEIAVLLKTLKGVAKFRTLEEQLGLDLEGDGKGHVKLTGWLLDQAGIGNRLNFNLELDQSCLGNSLGELKAVTETYPVRSN